jgi:Uma2 family endonuclease
MTLVKEKLETTRQPFKFSYRQLLEMDRAGILGDKRVELIDGELIEMSPPNPPHAIATMLLDNRFGQALGDKALVNVQNPLRLSPDMEDRNLPLPDIVVIKQRMYRDHPQPEDVYVLIEVADTSLFDDRGRKLSLYAKHGIFEYWIVNLIDKQIEVYTEPRGKEYLTRHTYGLTERFAPARFPELAQQWLPEELLELLS